ncbi:MAG: T9SS type A sorting domain-containing protein [Chitinophagales bacterium]|nr:T9SS type A sorting domain-containing protein [Chitinophagales bacterium]
MIGSGQLVLGQNTNWWDDYQCFDASEIIDLWNFQNYDFGGKGGYSTPLQKDANGHIALFDYCANCGVGGSPVDTPVPLDASGHPTTPAPIGYARHAKWARSECGLAYYPRYKPTEYGPVDPVDVLGDCTPCACADGATNIACDLLPDLVVSGWKIANNDTYFVGNPPTPFTDKGHELDPNTFKLKVNITVGNLGDGPFEIKRTHTDLNGNPLEDDSEDDERIHQVIYKKPVGGSGTIIEDETANANEITGAFHAEHGHFHVNNWVDVSLRSRPAPGTTDYNNPANWTTILGTSNKLSFCIVESNTPTCKHQYSMLDLRTSEQMAYLNTNLNFWNSTDADLQSILTTGATTYNHKIIYNQLSDFPNLALGKYNYSCEGAEHQAISPGYGDVYGTETPGNFINLPCNLAEGQYYIVAIVNPDGKFTEKPNGNLNNFTVVPYYFPGFTLPIPTAAPVNVQSWSYEEGEDGNTAIWTTPNRFNGMLIVPAGFTLTIQNTTMEFLTPGSGIIVEPGGTLILDHATLTNNDCLNNTWAGIHSWGTVIIDGCPMPLEAAISGVCLQNITATQSNTTINSFKAYQTAITPNNYTQNFSANLLGTQTSIPATFTYNPAGSTPYTFVSTINAGALCGGGTSLSGGGFCKIYQNASSMPAISIAGGGSSTFCAGEGETLVAPLGYPNYIWSNGVTTAQNTPTTSGTYTVTVTNAWGCTATAQTNLTISTATVAITTTPTPNTCTAQLTATVSNATGPFTFEWNDQPALNTQSITVSQAGLNFVEVSNAAGCVGLATVTLSTNDIVPLNFNGIYTVGTTTPALGIVAGNTETWTSLTKRISGTIVVPAGKTLTINSSTLTMAGTLTNIVVQPGGRLNLSGSILQADQCSSTYWQGISAKGNAVAYTNADPIIAFGTGNYGLVYATNSTIKNARIGVCNGLVQGSSVTNPGGIIDLDNTAFTDCGIAVRIAPTNFANQQPHLISNCTFKMALNTPFDANYWHPTELQPIGIWVKDVILPNTLYNNRFESTMPAATTTLDKRGIGMRLDNVKATIDAPTNAALEFDGLFKGIDANNLLTAVKFIALKRQNFGNTRKALTLNNTYGSSVGYCSFAVPPGLTSLLDTYGIMSYYSKGITIDQNTFTTTNQANKHTKGAIFENSTNGNTPSVLTNNLFDGSFEVATQFKDTNAKLSTNCNAYDDCQADWHLTSTANLPEQGFCLSSNANLSLRTHWHYITDPGLTGSNVRIKNSNTAFELKLNIDNSLNGYLEPQSNPKLPDPAYVDGWVTVVQCQPLDPTFTNNSCVVSWPIAGAAKTETECSNGSTLEQAIYNYLQQDQRDSLLLLLQCIDEEWTQKLLIGTYVDEGQYDLALAEMQKLDSTILDNAEFIALYTALMDSTLNTTPTEGGRIAMALNQTQAIANNPQSENKTLAEAVLALCQNADYVRYGDPISFKTNQPVKGNVDFKLIPNPTKDVVTIQLPNISNEPLSLTICDISGRLVQTIPIQGNTTTISTQQLATGMYLCKLSNSSQTQKLVVIK